MPSQTSILNILARASDKTSGQKLSSQQIVAQSQTFILAGAHSYFERRLQCAACWLIPDQRSLSRNLVP